MAKRNREAYKKKRYIIPIVIVVLLIAFRLYLPTLLKNYVNDTLANIPGYYGEVEDIDVSLIRGAYVLNNLYLRKVTAESKVPFLKFPETDISIEWSALFKGKIVTEITLTNPEVIYVFEDQVKEPEEGEPKAEDWSQALTDLVPIDINQFKVHGGKLAFVQLQADPDIDLHINNLELSAGNLRNVRQTERVLPSPIQASGTSIGNGNLSLDGKVNLMKEIPDMDIELSLEEIDATALNAFSNYYAGLDFASGTVGAYTEFAIADGHLEGYLKPLLQNIELVGEDDGFLKTLWEGFVEFFGFILKNQSTDTVATRVPIEGDLNNIESGIFPTILNIFKNAWIEAFKGEVDKDVEFEDAFQDRNEK